MTAQAIRLHNYLHLPQASDPVVPSMAYLPATVLVAPNGGSGSVETPFDGNPADFYTNNEGAFTIGSRVIDAVTCHGIIFNKVGHYKLEISGAPFWDATYPTGGNNQLYEYSYSGGGGDSSVFGGPQAQQLDATIHDQLGVTIDALQSVDGSVVTTPTLALIPTIRNYGNTTFNAGVTVQVFYIDADPTILG